MSPSDKSIIQRPSEDLIETYSSVVMVRDTREYALDLVLAFETASRTLPIPGDADQVGGGLIAAGSVFLGICRSRGLDAVAALHGVAGLAVPQTTTVH